MSLPIIIAMRNPVRAILAFITIVAAGWWLFWLTPSRSGRQKDAIGLAFWGDYQEYRLWQLVISDFQRTHPEIRVRAEYVPADYSRKLTAWMASGSGPDVMMLQDEPFPMYLEQSLSGRPVLAELTDLVSGKTFGAELGLHKDDYWPTAWESFADGNRQYALPVFGGNNLILYNRECFRRAGVELPEDSQIDLNWTNEQFVQLCRQLTVRIQTDGRLRTVQWGFSCPSGWLYWLPFFYAFDANILSQDRNAFIFTGPEAIDCLRFARDMYAVHHVAPRGADLGGTSENAAFLTGRVAMTTNGPWPMPFLNEAKLDYGVMFPPVSPTGKRGTRITWDGIGLAGRLTDDPARLKQAWTLARYIASPQTAEVFARAQRSIPAHRAGIEAFMAGDGSPGGKARAKKFVAALEFSRVQPITLHWARMDEILRSAMGRLLVSQQEDSTAAAQQTLDEIVNRVAEGGLFAVPPDSHRN